MVRKIGKIICVSLFIAAIFLLSIFLGLLGLFISSKILSLFHIKLSSELEYIFVYLVFSIIDIFSLYVFTHKFKKLSVKPKTVFFVLVVLSLLALTLVIRSMYF